MIKVGRNEPCPCGSQLKYKKCCWNKAFTWNIDDNQQIVKTIPLDQKHADMLKEYIKHREEKLGRKLEEHDRIFDPKDIPSIDEMCKLMEKAGIAPRHIYAYRKTDGLLLTEKNHNYATTQDIKEWHEAIDEYEEMQTL
jgi:hypothetical protein